jgi:hypothetical protein
MDLGIIFHAFAEKDILELHLYDLVFGFNEYKTIVAMMDINGGREIIPDLVHRGEETFEGKRSVEVTEDVHIGLFFFLLLFVGNADNDRVITCFFQAEHDLVVQQANIPEDKVGPVLGDERVNVCGRLAFSGKGKFGCFGDIIL